MSKMSVALFPPPLTALFAPSRRPSSRIILHTCLVWVRRVCFTRALYGVVYAWLGCQRKVCGVMYLPRSLCTAIHLIIIIIITIIIIIAVTILILIISYYIILESEF